MKLRGLLVLGALVCCPALANASLPFVGERYYDFHAPEGTAGLCTTERITIFKNGRVRIDPTDACPGIREEYATKGKSFYNGNYANLMKISLSDGSLYYYQIQGDKIYRLDSNKRLDKTCDMESPYRGICIADVVKHD